MTLYSTLAATKAIMASGTSSTTAENPLILSNIRIVSRRFDSEFASKRPIFAPYLETRKFLLTSGLVDSSLNTLSVPGGLLSLSSIDVGGTALVIGTNVDAWPDPTATPITTLRLSDDCASWYRYCSTTNAPLLVTITGVWGIHRDYANAWANVDALAAGITSSATTLTVADIDGTDIYGITPRISAGNLLKIDSEYLEVIATSTGTNTATVRRGVNGTTAAAHSLGAAVYTWMVEDLVQRATARQSALMYARFGAYTTMEVSGMSEVRFPVDLLGEMRAILQEYAYGY